MWQTITDSEMHTTGQLYILGVFAKLHGTHLSESVFTFLSLCKWAPHVIPNLHPPQSPPWPYQPTALLSARSGCSTVARRPIWTLRSRSLLFRVSPHLVASAAPPFGRSRPSPAPAATPSGRCDVARSGRRPLPIWPHPLRPPPDPPALDLADVAPS
jgi:hypothetical protein